MTTPFDRAATACGGIAGLARAIGTSVQTVSNWRERGIPVERCPAIERLTRDAGAVVMCEEMRPEVDWAALRDTQAKAAA